MNRLISSVLVVKRRPNSHCLVGLSPVHTSNNVEATGNIGEAKFDFVEATFELVATNGNNVERVS